MNAWCFEADCFNNSKWNALLTAYQSIRPLTNAEKIAYPTLCRGAAMRFLSSRLHDFTFHDKNALVTPKPPTEYIQKLDFHHHDHTFF
jgi:homoserine kinase type II